ncbi:MAG: putative phage hydrolase, partial [Burkholderiaceae bacterium]|nr:putative phage hydrolase [Burkholderiaceae bacterium]
VQDQKYALEALLHDASEAYLKDIPKPLKELLPDYRAIEARLQAVIRRKFGLPEQESDAVKRVDLKLLATERRDLMPEHDADWEILRGIQKLPQPIRAVHAGIAQAQFVRRYLQLTQ